MTTLADLRINYSRASLDEADAAPDPFVQFDRWFKEALAAKLPEPNTMTVATVGADGRPSARILLIKAVDERGFVFFTNYESRKGHDLAVNPHAALLFYWIELERQVRIEGRIEKTSADESDRYFASRPLGSRIGAWASEQSTVIDSRATLEAREKEVAARYGENRRARRTGAATASCPTRSNSGRAARRGCTIDCSIRATTPRRRAGRSRAWRRKRRRSSAGAGRISCCNRAPASQDAGARSETWLYSIQRTNGDSKCSGKRSWHSGRTKYGRRRTYRRASCCGTASNSISARSARRRSR
jgi:pyridoxamine 5'-phosphate oxidase